METPKPRTRNTVIPAQLYNWLVDAREVKGGFCGMICGGVVGATKEEAMAHFREHYPLPQYPHIESFEKTRPYVVGTITWRLGHDPVTGLKDS